MNHGTGSLLVFVVVLAGCPTDNQNDDGLGDDDADGCVDETELLPTDIAITGLTRTSDGTLWAMGNAFRWWANSGFGWEPVDSLRGTGGDAITTEGSTLWAAGQWGVFRSEGASWTDESAGLPDGGTLRDVAGLGDGRIAMVSSQEVNEGGSVRVRLYVWDGVSSPRPTSVGWTSTAVWSAGTGPGLHWRRAGVSRGSSKGIRGRS